MRELLFFIYILGVLNVLYAGSINKIEDVSNALDIFLKENPEYVAETIMVNVRLPEVRLSSETVDLIIKHDLAAKLRKYKSSGKIILSLAKYPWGRNADTSYVFEPVTPDQPTDIKIINGSMPEIIGYLRYDDIYILLNDSFRDEIIQSDSTTHYFRLKLVKQIRDESCNWNYAVNDTAIRIYFSPESSSPDSWRPQIIKLMNKMDEHDF